MIKDQEKENVMEFLSSVLNTEYEYQTLKSKAYHIPYIDIPSKYKNYRISTFIFYYQLDCLFENGLIDEDTKVKLNELYSYYLELDNKLRDYVIMENDAYRRKETLEEKNLGHNEEELELLKKELNEIKYEMNIIFLKQKEIAKIFANYHLLEEINLGQLIENSVHVDDKNYDLNSEIEKINKSKTK